MKNTNIFNGLHIHLVGIGGISMSGLAKLLKSQGAIVSGSDIYNSEIVAQLTKLNIKVNIPHNAETINPNMNLVVYTGAVGKDNIEILKAKSLNIKTMERSEFLGIISRIFRNIIAVAGTHGKTTTASILANILYCAGLNPTIHVGGEMLNFDTNTYIGGSEYLVLEACEYKNSFGYLNPDLSVITNIESDHLDYYKDYDNLKKAFLDFAKNSKAVISSRNDVFADLIVGKDIEARNIDFVSNGYNFDVYYKDEFYANFRLNLIGIHNVDNALFAISVAIYMGIDRSKIIKGVATFEGVKRRYELIYKLHQVPVICDYAHHPTEISSSLKGIMEVYKNPLIIFEPHTYSRTINLFDDFVNVLSKYSNVVLFRTYPAREKEILGGSAKDLFFTLKQRDNNCFLDYIDDFSDVQKLMNDWAVAQKCDVIVVLGAGELYNLLKYGN